MILFSGKAGRLAGCFQHPYTRALREAASRTAPDDFVSRDIFFSVLRAFHQPIPGSAAHLWPSILIG